MPKAAEEALKREAAKKGFAVGSDRWRRYVYGGLRRIGWKPSRERRHSRTLALVRRRRRRRK